MGIQLSAFFLCLSAPAVAQTTWTVDDNGTGDFVHIQDAVDSAQDGDVILVLDGAYAGFTIDGKSLVVAGEPSGDVRVAAVVAVRNLSATQKVELDHLRIGLTFVCAGASSLTLDDNAGSVRIVDCEVRGFICTSSDPVCCVGGAALGCHSSLDVGVLRSTLTAGGVFDYNYYRAPPGIDASFSNVIITDSTVVGGDGYQDNFCEPGRGGPGAHIRDSSTLRSFGTTFDGGLSNTCNCPFSCNNPPDGEGIEVLSGSTGEWKASTFNGLPGPETGPFARTEIASFCFGTWEECPCGNNGAAGAGCETSYDSGGVLLSAAGNPSVSADTITLNAVGLRPNANPTGLFFQGTNQVNGGMGTPFNDGLLCTNAGIVRLKGKLATNGSVSFGFGIPNDAPVSVRGQIPAAGGTRTYQLWFRHAAPQFCVPERFHMSNAVEITWLP